MTNKPARGPLLHLPIAEWPQVDRDLMREAFWVPKDLFSEEANGYHLRPATKSSITFAYRRWLGWIVAYHPNRLSIAPAERPDLNLLREYVLHLSETNSECSVATQVRLLHDALRYMSPDKDWSWLRSLKARLERAVPKRGRRPMLINSQRLVDAGHAMMNDAVKQLEEAETTLSAKRLQAIALLYRNGLLVSLAAFLAYRRRNLASLFIGSTLRRIDEVWIVDISGEEVKNNEDLLSELPLDLGERIDSFLSTFRPLITRSSTHSGLWASAKGRPASGGALYIAFCAMVRKKLGISIRLHDVRSIGVTTWVIHDPLNAGGAKDLLGDRSKHVIDAYTT